MHVNELLRLGADIQIDGKVPWCRGVSQLGATVIATDARLGQLGDCRLGGAGQTTLSTASTTWTAATSRWRPSCAVFRRRHRKAEKAAAQTSPPHDHTGTVQGRIFEENLPLLQNITVLEDPEQTRKLILATSQSAVRAGRARTDVPTYVQYGGADLGVTGLDTLIEHQQHWARRAVPAAGLGHFALPRQRGGALRLDYARGAPGARLKVATKYVNIARDFFCRQGRTH